MEETHGDPEKIQEDPEEIWEDTEKILENQGEVRKDVKEIQRDQVKRDLERYWTEALEEIHGDPWRHKEIWSGRSKEIFGRDAGRSMECTARSGETQEDLRWEVQWRYNKPRGDIGNVDKTHGDSKKIREDPEEIWEDTEKLLRNPGEVGEGQEEVKRAVKI
jgi:ElaB/YqjD/DUF883 family membrane-anchored ribosome-binding protein